MKTYQVVKDISLKRIVVNDSAREFRRAKELLSETLVADLEKLKAELGKYCEEKNLIAELVAEYIIQIESLQQQNKILVEALEFYADGNNYKNSLQITSSFSSISSAKDSKILSIIDRDRGKQARAPLAAVKEKA